MGWDGMDTMMGWRRVRAIGDVQAMKPPSKRPPIKPLNLPHQKCHTSDVNPTNSEGPPRARELIDPPPRRLTICLPKANREPALGASEEDPYCTSLRKAHNLTPLPTHTHIHPAPDTRHIGTCRPRFPLPIMAAEDSDPSGLFAIALSDSEDDGAVATHDAGAGAPHSRTGQSEEEFQAVRRAYRVKVENGEVGFTPPSLSGGCWFWLCFLARRASPLVNPCIEASRSQVTMTHE